MLTKQMDILTDQETESEQKQQYHWLVMQSLKYRKWILSVIKGDFSEYQVTELMSENVELIIQYADYLNKGLIGNLIDKKQAAILEQVKQQYLS